MKSETTKTNTNTDPHFDPTPQKPQLQTDRQNKLNQSHKFEALLGEQKALSINNKNP